MQVADMRRLLQATIVAASISTTALAQIQGPVVYAAGSLREAFTEIAALWSAQGRPTPTLVFGASGLLRQRIEIGEPAQVFASADTGHPQALASRGEWQPPVVFTRNVLCALVQPGIDITSDTLLATLLRSDIRLGTSTPRADPSGDYAFSLFKRADALIPGASARLESKAMLLTGGPNSPNPPIGRGTYAWLMDSGQADIFLTYCTNAVAAQREVPRLRSVAIPPELQVGADYGLTVREAASTEARDFAQFLRSGAAQAVLARLGFGTP
jgi:ABC-type molybdate transport system substrate-binding protein